MSDQENKPNKPQKTNNPGSAHKTYRWSIEDIVVTIVLFFGFGGAVLLSLVTNAQSAIIAVLLASAMSALVHRFLGGLAGSEFVFGAIKLAGTMGTLMGVFFVLNHYLETQSGAGHKQELRGAWRWRYQKDGWVADAVLAETKDRGKYDVTGVVRKGDGGPVLFEITKGSTASLTTPQGNLDISWNVIDHVRNRQVIWKTPEPLVPGLCFSGKFYVQPQNPSAVLEPEPWGLFLHRP